jgi:hypothetical protein
MTKMPMDILLSTQKPGSVVIIPNVKYLSKKVRE